MSKKKIQVFEYEGKKITFDFGDGLEMVNATEIIKVFEGKRLRDFTRLKQTKDFIKELENEMNRAESADPRGREKAIKRVVGGNRKDLQGTWYEQRLVLKLAAWLSPKFEVWVFGKIKELLTTGSATLTDDKIIIDRKTFQFLFDKHRSEQSNFNHFLDSLLKGDDKNE